MTTLTINGKQHTLDLEPDTPLLWAIRNTIGLTGTKYGCGIQQCGACTVHVNGRTVRSCGMPRVAAESGAVDEVLNPEQIARRLIELS